LKVLVGVAIGYIIGVAVMTDQTYELAVDHEQHEKTILKLETDLDSCEDAWHTDLAECRLELDECQGNIGQEVRDGAI
jgi:hypothetical protein